MFVYSVRYRGNSTRSVRAIVMKLSGASLVKERSCKSALDRSLTRSLTLLLQEHSRKNKIATLNEHIYSGSNFE